MYSDLHIHSKYSDGTNTLEEIIKLTKENNVKCISLVDHDTIDGVKKLKKLAKLENIDVINGVEISTSLNKTRIHILGYGVNLENNDLINYLDELAKARTQNTKKIFENNVKRGTLKYNWDEVMKYFNNYSWINSSHVFEAMKNDGIYQKYSDFMKFYTNYFGLNSGVYEDIEGFTAKSAIEVIRKAKGTSVIAHPKLINDDEHILKLIKHGVDGIEVFHPSQNIHEKVKYKQIAKQNNLIITGGTDWHGGWSRYCTKIGESGIIKEYLDKLKEKIYINQK